MPMRMDAFNVIKDWYHFAILELVSLTNFQSDPNWMAAKLNLTSIQVENAIERLIRLGLLKREFGKVVLTNEYTVFGNEQRSDAIRNFHKQILEKAFIAIEQQNIHRREYSASILAVNGEDIPSINKDVTAHGVRPCLYKLVALGNRFFP